MNIIEQIKALFSKKTWSSSDANVSAQKILLGDANAEPSGIIGMNDLASVLGAGLVQKEGAGVDLDTCGNGIFRTVSPSSGGFSPLSSGWHTIVSITYGDGGAHGGCQIACGGVRGTIIAIRGCDHNVWSPWIQLS